MPKSNEMENILNTFTTNVFNRKRDGSCCVTCGNTNVAPKDFRNDISRIEFKISYMCQKCQDSVFGID